VLLVSILQLPGSYLPTHPSVGRNYSKTLAHTLKVNTKPYAVLFARHKVHGVGKIGPTAMDSLLPGEPRQGWKDCCRIYLESLVALNVFIIKIDDGRVQLLARPTAICPTK
jgi:hypothetical protein